MECKKNCGYLHNGILTQLYNEKLDIYNKNYNFIFESTYQIQKENNSETIFSTMQKKEKERILNTEFTIASVTAMSNSPDGFVSNNGHICRRICISLRTRGFHTGSKHHFLNFWLKSIRNVKVMIFIHAGHRETFGLYHLKEKMSLWYTLILPHPSYPPTTKQ